MRVFVLFMLLILAVGVAGFISFNHGNQVKTISLGAKVFHDVPLSALILWTFGLGVIWAMVVFIIQEIRLRLKISTLKTSIRHLEGELGELRTMPLADLGIDKEEK